jgi:hypothetical protein
VIQVFDPPSKQARGEHAHIQAHKESPGTAVGRNQTSATNRARSLPVGRVRHSDRLVLRRIRKQASFRAAPALGAVLAEAAPNQFAIGIPAEIRRGPRRFGRFAVQSARPVLLRDSEWRCEQPPCSQRTAALKPTE